MRKNNSNLFWPLENLKEISLLRKFKIDTAEITSCWQMIDLASDALQKKIKRTHISSLAIISSKAIIEGDVIIEDGVRVLEHAKIIGPAYLGKDVIIGNSVLVRKSYIGEGCVVGYMTDITRSCIGTNCWFSRAHIADSFLDNDVCLGSGTVLASLRLDGNFVSVQVKGEKVPTDRTKLGVIIGKRTQIGANVVILPGKRIGKDCMVGAGVVVSEDIKDNQYCKVFQKLAYRKNIFSCKSSVYQELKRNLLQELSL